MRAARILILLALTLPAPAMAPDSLPPNTVMLSQMMRELSAQPGFTETFLREVQGAGHKRGAALLTPALIHHMRNLILGKDWQGLDHFPGWTMGEINPTVRVIGKAAGNNPQIDSTATAGGRPGSTTADASSTFLDLGPMADPPAANTDLDQPATGPGFDEHALVSSLGDNVTRGDGPNPQLAPLHAASQRLADVLNRLSLNEADSPAPTATLAGHTVTTPQALVAALQSTGHTVTVTDSRYFANFGHLHHNGQDVMMPFWINTEIRIPGGRRPLLVPVAHAEYEWLIRGPIVNAAVAFYFGIDGKAEFRTMDQLDQAWVMKRNAHTYTGAQAVEVTRLAAATVRLYLHLHAAYPDLPFGGYYALGVCQDSIAAIELKLTGQATLFPNTADDRYFIGPNADKRDAEMNTLIRRLPKDRNGRLPEPERIFASLPVGSSDAELRTVTIPGLADDLIAVHDAWTEGSLHRTRHTWRFWTLIGLGVLLLLGAAWWLNRRH